MHLCRTLLAALEPNGRPLGELFDACEGPHMQRLMRFARLGLVEIDAGDLIRLTQDGHTVVAALSSGVPDPPGAAESDALTAFERLVGRLIGPPLAIRRPAA